METTSHVSYMCQNRSEEKKQKCRDTLLHGTLQCVGSGVQDRQAISQPRISQVHNIKRIRPLAPLSCTKLEGAFFFVHFVLAFVQ